MKKFSRRIAAIMSMIMIISISVSAIEIKTYSENLHVYLNGKDVYENSENKPLIINDRTMVPLRPIFEAMGWSNEEITYDDIEKKAYFKGGNCSCEFVNDKETAVKYEEDGTQTEFELDVPATIYNGNFYIPLRAFCELWSFNISWNETERSVIISEQGYAGSTVIPGVVPNDTDITNLNDYQQAEMAIAQMVYAGVLPLNENGEFEGTKEMTVAEVNDSMAKFVSYVAETYGCPELRNHIPQITNKDKNEKATIGEVINLLNDPGVSLGANEKEWVEMNQSFILAALKEAWGVVVPENGIEWLSLFVPPSYLATMYYDALNAWKLLGDWNEGYTKQISGVSSGGVIADFDGKNYYYVSSDSNDNNVAGVYSENGENIVKLSDVKPSIQMIGAYNGYLFYIDSSDNICRVRADGKYNRQLTWNDNYADAVICNNYLYYYNTSKNEYRVSSITENSLEDVYSAITAEEYKERKKVDGNLYKPDNINHPLPSLNSFHIYKNDASKTIEATARGLGNIVVYNGYIYYVLENLEKSEVELKKVDINLQASETIAVLSNIQTSGHNILSVCGDYAFLSSVKERNIMSNMHTYVRVNINEKDSRYGQVSYSFAGSKEQTEVSHQYENSITSHAELVSNLTTGSGVTWLFDMTQTETDYLTFNFNEDGTVIVRGYPDINKTMLMTKMESTYTIVDNETIEIKWDLFGWRDFVDENNNITENMPTTIFRLKKGENNGRTLECTEAVSDYFEDWTPVLEIKSTSDIKGYI